MDYLIILILIIIVALIYNFYPVTIFKKDNLDFILPIIDKFSDTRSEFPNEFENDKTDETQTKINNFLSSIYINDPPEYMNSKFLRNVHHTDVFYDGKFEFKIYPLCCLTCKINAIREVRYLQELSEYSIPVTYEIFTTNKYPNKNIDYTKYYLVVKREHLNLLDDVKSINFESFLKLLKTITVLQNKYETYLPDLTINNLGVDSEGNIKILDLCCKPLRKGVNIYAPKYGILNKLNPDLFGINKDKYVKFSELITKNKISF